LVSFNDFWVKEASTPIYVKGAPSDSTATIKGAADAEDDEEDVVINAKLLISVLKLTKFNVLFLGARK